MEKKGKLEKEPQSIFPFPNLQILKQHALVSLLHSLVSVLVLFFVGVIFVCLFVYFCVFIFAFSIDNLTKALVTIL